MCHQCAGVGHDSERSNRKVVAKPDGKGDDDNPLFRQVVERMTSGRPTFNHEWRYIRVDRHLFRDAVGIRDARPRCERRQSKADESAQRWRVIVRFLDNSAYFEHCAIILDEDNGVVGEHCTA